MFYLLHQPGISFKNNCFHDLIFSFSLCRLASVVKLFRFFSIQRLRPQLRNEANGCKPSFSMTFFFFFYRNRNIFCTFGAGFSCIEIADVRKLKTDFVKMTVKCQCTVQVFFSNRYRRELWRAPAIQPLGVLRYERFGGLANRRSMSFGCPR